MEPISKTAAARIVLWTVLIAYVSILPIIVVMDMSVDVHSTTPIFVIVGGLAPILIYAWWRRMAVVPESMICVMAVVALTLPVLVWTYAAMRVGMPLADAELAAMDAALGFDWFAFIAFVDGRPMLAHALALAYSSFFFQLLLLPFLIALAGFPQRAYAMIFAYCLLCLISSVVCIWYPALGTFVVYEVGFADLASINAKFGFFFLDQFHAVRESGHFRLVMEESAGIVTYPSVHAGVAALCAWAAWPVRLLRYPMLVLNVAMATSAVSHANHYLVDIVAGVGITGLCVSVAGLVFYRRAEGAGRVMAVTRWASVRFPRFASSVYRPRGQVLETKDS